MQSKKTASRTEGSFGSSQGLRGSAVGAEGEQAEHVLGWARQGPRM